MDHDVWPQRNTVRTNAASAKTQLPHTAKKVNANTVIAKHPLVQPVFHIHVMTFSFGDVAEPFFSHPQIAA